MEWIVIGVQSGAAWPMEETNITFKGRQLILRPETKDIAPSIATQIESREQYDQTVSLMREFMSSWSWVEGSPIEEIMITGGSHPINVGKGPMWSVKTYKFDRKYMPEPSDEKAIVALAIYREALTVNSVPYKFLGFAKILNVIHQDGKSQIAWINQNLPLVKDNYAIEQLKRLQVSVSDVGEHLYGSGRCAVAHAFADPLINPDKFDDWKRLGQEMPVIRALAEIAIENELGIKSLQTHYREHLYELSGFKKLLPEDFVDKLMKGESPDITDQINFPCLDLEVNEKHFDFFKNLIVLPLEAKNGVLLLSLYSDAKEWELHLGLNFPEERLQLNFVEYAKYGNADSPEVVTFLMNLYKMYLELFSNGRVQLKISESQVVISYTDPYIPVNVDLSATTTNFERAIEFFAKRLESLNKS